MTSRSHFCLWISVSFLLDYLFFLSFFFNWGTGAFQCCSINLYCIAKWIGYRCPYAPSLQCFPPLPPPVPLAYHRAPSWASCTISRFPLPVWCRAAHIHHPNLPVHALPLSRVHLPVLFICVSISALEIGSSVPFFSKGLYLIAVSLVINSHFQVWWKENIRSFSLS